MQKFGEKKSEVYYGIFESGLFLEWSQLSVVFYHSVTHGLSFFICFMI